MSESRIKVPTAELAKTFRIWLSVIRQRHPQMVRDLWTRKGEPHDGEKIRSAQDQLANELARRLETAKWEVSRRETPQDAVWRAAQADGD